MSLFRYNLLQGNLETKRQIDIRALYLKFKSYEFEIIIINANILEINKKI